MSDEFRAYNRDGIALAQQGRLAEAQKYFETAVRLEPRFAGGFNNLGNVLVHLGRYDEAAASFAHALELSPDDPETYNNLSNAYRKQGRFQDAEACCRQALWLRPQFPEAHNNLGVALELQGRLAEAQVCYQEALRQKPDFVDAHNHLGNLLRQLGKFEEAVACIERSLQLNPHLPEAHNNLGAAYMGLGNLDRALLHCRRALELHPQLAEAYCNLANVYSRQGRLADSIAACNEALRLNPDMIDVENNIGVVAMKEGRLKDALARFNRLLQKKPDCPQTHVNRAMALLLEGNFEEGFREYEWRWRCNDFGLVPLRQPYWDGADVAGKTVLLGSEQGLGDTIQFVRYAPLLKDRRARVIVACQEALLKLVSRCPGIDQCVAVDAPLPPFDVYAPLLSLPHILKTTLTTIPGRQPYVFAAPSLVEHWRGELAKLPGFKVGIAWQGSRKHLDDYLRSIPLKNFEALAKVPGVHLCSLQKGQGHEQLTDCSFAVTDLGRRLDETAGAFMDTAAAMLSLDLVITSDTAIAHLAGALGVPVWVALPAAPDWRWLVQGEDCPWYPTMRLFRQSHLLEWTDVFERMARELAHLGSVPMLTATVTVEVGPGKLLDKITILEIKRRRITDPDKLRNIVLELEALTAARDRCIRNSPDLQRLAEELRTLNESLWETGNALRQCERQQDFGVHFVELARSAYRQNDRRAALKRQIDAFLGKG